MIKGYKEKCEEFIKAWLDKNTLYRSKNVAVQDYKESIVNVSIEIKNKFVVSSNTPSVAGVKEAAKGDESCLNKEQYLQAIQRQIDEAYSNDDNFKTFFKHIKNRAYDYTNCTDSTQILRNKNSIYYTHQCSNCRGSGTLKCNCNNGVEECSCQNGRVECSAWGCKNGRIKCDAWSCKGGKIEKSRRQNGQSVKYFEPCGKCRGAGFLSCKKCSGSGFLTHSKCGGSGVLTCSRCGGSTFIKCRSCNTSGMQTDIATIICSTEPKYEVIYPNDIDEKLKLAIEEVGEKNFTQIAEIKRTEIKALDAEKAVFESYEVSVPMAEFNIAIKNKTYPFKLYGSDVRVLESGKIPLKANFYRAVVSVLAVVAVVAFACYLYIVTSPQNSSSNVELSDNKPQQNTIKLSIKSGFVNLRQSPNGKIIGKIYAKDLDKITLEKLDGGNEKWIKVLYFPPSVTDETKAISGYIHSSKIDKNSLQK